MHDCFPDVFGNTWGKYWKAVLRGQVPFAVSDTAQNPHTDAHVPDAQSRLRIWSHNDYAQCNVNHGL